MISPHAGGMMGVCYGGARQTPPRRCLAVVLVSLFTLHGVAVIGECASLRRWSGVASRSMLRARLTFSAVIATFLAAAPYILVPFATQGRRELLVYVGAGLMSSSILL